MLIQCPECQFDRDIDTSKIPVTATLATCPRCGARFRFRPPPGLPGAAFGMSRSPMGKPAHVQPMASPPPSPASSVGGVAEDDPLPPGATFPRFHDDDSQVSTAYRQTNNDSQREEFRQGGELLGTLPGNPVNKSGLDKPGAQKKESPLDQNVKNVFDAGSWGDADSSDTEAEIPHSASSRDFAGEDNVRPEDLPPAGIPWEHPERYGFLGSFFHTILQVMFRGAWFFSQIRDDSSLARPVVFCVLLDFFFIVAAFFWLFGPTNFVSADQSQMQVYNNFIQSFRTPLFVLTLPFVLLIQLIIKTFFFYLMLRLAQPDRVQFNLVLRVLSYSAAPLILAMVPVLGSVIGWVWSIAASVIGCKYAFRLSWGKTALALVPLFLLAAGFLLQMGGAMMSVV